MKKYLLVALSFLLLLACKGEKQNPVTKAGLKSKPVTINLMLIKEIPADISDLKDYIQFYIEGDSVGSIIGKPNEFTTTVFAGNKVKWKSAKESINKIKIKNIILKKVPGNINILESENISQDPNEVERKVKMNLNDGDIESYSLEIEIEKKPYTIDPKLKYHQ
jgi:hypothetical protein